MVERILETITLPDGMVLDICQQMNEYDDGEVVPGLLLARVGGGKIPTVQAYELLKAAHRTDVIGKYNVPAEIR